MYDNGDKVMCTETTTMIHDGDTAHGESESSDGDAAHGESVSSDTARESRGFLAAGPGETTSRGFSAPSRERAEVL